MEREVVGNKPLEEFLERLLRWDELCTQLRELYYRYLDLAAFRSEKCYFPGRRCKRSWNRQYDVGDLTLMWTYILNTAPLCGKLIRALAEVEYEIRKRALESLEKYGGTEKSSKPEGSRYLTFNYLNKPVHFYLVFWKNLLYVIVGDSDESSKKLRRSKSDRKFVEIIKRYTQDKDVDLEIMTYNISDDTEYERLWLEVPLPKSATRLLSGRNKAPVALFRNLGWLLSDDNRNWISHTAGNPGQIATRLFDWIALAKYTVKALTLSKDVPMVFKLVVYNTTKTKDGINPLIEVWPIGNASRIITNTYEYFGIKIGEPIETLLHGYSVLGALRTEAFRRQGKTYVVDDPGAWIAYSAILSTMIVGDGIASVYGLRIAVKLDTVSTSQGEVSLINEFAKAIGVPKKGKDVGLKHWQTYMLLPTPATPAFDKTAKVYDILTNYPVAAEVEIGGNRYLFCHVGFGRFDIAGSEVKALYEKLTKLGIHAVMWKKHLFVSIRWLEELKRRGIPVRLLTDLEKESIRKVRSHAQLDIDEFKKVLEELAGTFRVVVGTVRGNKFVKFVFYDRVAFKRAVEAFKRLGIGMSVPQHRKEIYVYEKRVVETILEIVQNFS